MNNDWKKEFQNKFPKREYDSGDGWYGDDLLIEEPDELIAFISTVEARARLTALEEALVLFQERTDGDNKIGYDVGVKFQALLNRARTEESTSDKE